MRTIKHLMIGLISVALLVGAIGLVQPLRSQAEVEFGGFKKILKKFFPPCGPGTRDQRFVVSKDGTKVCDNKTGLWWQQSPNTSLFNWTNALVHCVTLSLHSGELWRLPEVRELQSLVDYHEPDQAAALNEPNGPFQNVQPAGYWSATPNAFDPGFAWFVQFNLGIVDIGSEDFIINRAWCVSDGQNAHSH